MSKLLNQKYLSQDGMAEVKAFKETLYFKAVEQANNLQALLRFRDNDSGKYDLDS